MVLYLSERKNKHNVHIETDVDLAFSFFKKNPSSYNTKLFFARMTSRESVGGMRQSRF